MKAKLVLLSIMITCSAISCAMNFCGKKDFSHQIKEDFRLDIKGYTKTVPLHLKYRDIYAFAITNGEVGFPEKYNFKGKLKLQFYYHDRLVRETDIERQDITLFMTTKPGFYSKEIYLAYFNMPLDHRYMNNLSLKVTVVEPDLQLAEFGKEVKIVIGVSGKE